MHMTIAAMLQDHRILKCDQVLLLDGPQLETHLLSFLHLGEADHHKVAHAVQEILLVNHDDDWNAAMVDETATEALTKKRNQQRDHDSRNASIAPP